MIYWDSSALVASLVLEDATQKISEALEELDEERSYTTMITPLEVESAIQRKLKERSLTPKQANEARKLTMDFRKNVFLMATDHNVLDMGLHLQKIYGLRPADAIQLASARIGTDNPANVFFLCLDEKLNEAAKSEGFQTI